jgi:two-component system sensor histidine kinase UhpB
MTQALLKNPVDDIGQILLVEDNAGDAEYIGALLADDHHDILCVETLMQATALLERREVSAVLLDLRLPDGLGVDCVKAIREAAPHVPVIALTGLDDQILALRCLAAGAQDYISKNELRSYNLLRVIRYALVRTREAQAQVRAGRLETLLAEVVKASDLAIISGTTDGAITSWNRAAERMFGLRAEEAIGRQIADVVRVLDEQDATGKMYNFAPAMRGESLSSEVVRMGQDGRPMTLWLSAFGIPDEDGSIPYFGTICRDVTEQRRQVDELNRQYEDLQDRDEQMRALAARLDSIREEEQLRISRELHDELGQLLMGLKMNLHWVDRAFSSDPSGGTARHWLADATKLVDSTVQAVQRISAELRPDALELVGLSGAIEEEVGRFRHRTGIHVICHTQEDNPPPPRIAITFFRIFQEMMTNVVRHALASTVWVDFQSLAQEWRLSVRDDGKGFTEPTGDRASLGLLGMRERAQIHGGQIEIDTSLPQGVAIIAHIPRE